MGKIDPRVSAYIARSADFAKPILNHLRTLIHNTCPTVEETIKWGFPHFEYKGPADRSPRVLCHMASFKQHCTFGFWYAEMKEAPGREGLAGTAMGQYGRIASLADLPKEKALVKQIREAIKLHDAGIKSPAKPRTEKQELDVPDYFIAALKKKKRALTTFEAFSYSHKKEYVEWVTEAKTEETRKTRLETAIEWMSEGKSRNWKYARK